MTYEFDVSNETIGKYKCRAENELGQIDSQTIQISTQPSIPFLSKEKLPIYSDAIVFEWIVYSGSSINELELQLTRIQSDNSTSNNNNNTTTKIIKAQTINAYHSELIMYKDYYELTNLVTNTSYFIRARAKNDQNESGWSKELIVTTHVDPNQKLKHRASHLPKKHHNSIHHDSRKHNGVNVMHYSGSGRNINYFGTANDGFDNNAINRNNAFQSSINLAIQFSLTFCFKSLFSY